MRTSHIRNLKLVWVVIAAGCAAPSQEDIEVAAATSALSVSWIDGANEATADVEPTGPECVGTEGILTLTGSFTVLSPATVWMLYSLDGSIAAEIPVVFDTEFIPAGRTFVASFDEILAVPDGSHAVDLCFALDDGRGAPSTVQGCVSTMNSNLSCAAPTDTTPPTITGARAPAANAQGWNNTDVTVSFMCDDPESGITSCTAPVTVSTEDANQSVTGTAVNGVGLSADATVSGINIDKTAPSISAMRSVGPNAQGWNNTDVTVSFTCDDELSGILSCSAPVTLSSEGAGQSASGDASDNADNTANASEGPISIDKTNPTVSFSGTGTYDVGDTVNVTCSASDGLSGIASSTCADVSGPAYTFGVGTHAVSATATDNADNTGSGNGSFTVEVTTAGLCKLFGQFSSSSSYTKKACARLAEIESNLLRGRIWYAKFKIFSFCLWMKSLPSSVLSRAEKEILSDLLDELV